MAEIEETDIKAALKKLATARVETSIYYRYYDGEHALNFASTKFRNKFGRRLQRLTDNLCKPVVNAPVNRLEVLNFAADGNADDQERFWQIWKQNLMPGRSKNVHREAFRTGKAYVIVWADDKGKARMSPQTTGDIYVWFTGESREPSKAAKLWFDETEERHYLTLYFPDRIEKYVTTNKSKSFPNANSFIEREVDGEPWPLPNPFARVPVFEFAAPEKQSILSDVIPLQDALNKHFCDLMVAGEYNSIRQRWTTGIQYEVDEETNKPIVPYDHDDPVWSTSGEEGKFGEFSDSPLEQYLKAKSDTREEIARVTGIPAHYFQMMTGHFPSGEALRTAESRFISMVQDAQLDFGESWADAIKFALQIESGIVTPDASYVETQWRDAAPVGQRELLENGLMKKQLGVSTERILSELGYTESDIADILDQSEKEKVSLASAVQTAFNGGIGVEDHLAEIG